MTGPTVPCPSSASSQSSSHSPQIPSTCNFAISESAIVFVVSAWHSSPGPAEATHLAFGPPAATSPAHVSVKQQNVALQPASSNSSAADSCRIIVLHRLSQNPFCWSPRPYCSKPPSPRTPIFATVPGPCPPPVSDNPPEHRLHRPSQHQACAAVSL